MASLGQIHVEIKSMIYFKLGIKMRFHEIPISCIEEMYPAICETPSLVS
jgi:hypothetical protein